MIGMQLVQLWLGPLKTHGMQKKLSTGSTNVLQHCRRQGDQMLSCSGGQMQLQTHCKGLSYSRLLKMFDQSR